MIYAITFNPALDISGKVDRLIPNEKCYVHHEIQTPGGNGINAGIIASRLNGNVLLSGFVGGNNGKMISRLLKKEKLKQKFISINGDTRINVTISEGNSHKQTRLSFAGPQILKNEWSQLLRILKKAKPGKDLVLLGGSLPPGVSVLMVSSLVLSLRQKNVFCMVDMPGESLKKIIRSRPHFIKPNLQEFQDLTKTNVTSLKSVLGVAKDLNKFIPLICISSVEGGALLVNKKEAWFGKTPKISIHSTVGAGDSMVGAMAALLSKNPDTPLCDLLKLGLAASCATLTCSGLTLGSFQSVKSFEQKVRVKNIKDS